MVVVSSDRYSNRTSNRYAGTHRNAKAPYRYTGGMVSIAGLLQVDAPPAGGVHGSAL